MPCVHHMSCRWVTAYNARHRRNELNEITINQLQYIQEVSLKWHDQFTKLFVQHMGSKGHTMKMHRYVHHFLDSVQRLGHSRHYSAQMYEGHHRVTKALSKAINYHADASGQTTALLVRAHRKREIAIRSGLDLTDAAGEEKGTYQTAFTRAIQQCKPILVGEGQRIRLSDIAAGTCELAQQQPELKQLPDLISHHWQHNVRGDQQRELQDNFRMHKTCIILAEVGEA